MNFIDTELIRKKIVNDIEIPSFNDFIDAFKAKMNQVFHVRGVIDKMSTERGLPPFVLREIMSTNPLSISIPKEYGGRGGKMYENLAMLAEASYESLALSLNMGGLMITEPDFGSDALNMKTSYTEENNHFHVTGTKHWAGLTGWADYWLLTARKQTISGDLQRDIDFFVCDVR
jgi:alkylation response protein AidB-like acyl-CoA dehydrogenase